MYHGSRYSNLPTNSCITPALNRKRQAPRYNYIEVDYVQINEKFKERHEIRL